MEIKDIVAIWGGLLSTALACVKGWEMWRNTLRIGVEATMIFGSGDDDYGTKIQTEHGDRTAYLGISVLNKRDKPFQAFCIVVHSKTYVQQIRAADLPSILQPGSRLETRVQKEWLDDLEATALGVMTGTGREKLFSKADFKALAQHCRSMPSRWRQYVRRDDPTIAPVWAWQVKDAVGLKSKKR